MSTVTDPLLFDPADPLCKRPYGAVPSGTCVSFTLRPRRARGYSRAVLTARFESQGDRRVEVEMPWSGWDGDRDQFSCTLDTRLYQGLVWYTFRISGADGRGEQSKEYQLTVYDGSEQVPDWFGQGVTYQIFPDRFRRLSIPDPAGMVGDRWVHENWEDLPDYHPDGRGEVRNRDYFGGSLAGIREKLPYLQSMGVETLYLCPIFEAAENHRYGAADYEKIDPMLGSNEEFTQLCADAHGLGMRIMLDGVFNHTGFVSKYFNGDGFYPEPGAFQSRESQYANWFTFQNWPKQYTSWWGIYSMPTTNKDCEDWLNYITGENGVIRSWLRAGADGWRLDVADELPDRVVHAIHAAARAEDPNAVVIGEVWEDGSTKIAYGVRRKHLLGRHCDGLMNYPFRNALLDFLQGEDASHFKNAMETVRENYPSWAFTSAMNFLGTHDTPRVLTLLGTGGTWAGDNKDARARFRLSPEQRERGAALLKLGAMVLYAFPGSPTLYYGDEAGMEGLEDPFNRQGYPWGREDAALQSHFAALGRARRDLEPLRRGDLKWLRARGRVLAFARTWNGQCVVAAVNAGSAQAHVALPWGETLLVPPMTGRLVSGPPMRLEAGEPLSSNDWSLTQTGRESRLLANA